MGASLIELENVSYTYGSDSSSPVQALRGIDLRIAEGEYVAVVGHNGSGKSTLAKCMNGLLHPSGGTVRVRGLDTRDAGTVYQVRATVGVVFQNPDNHWVLVLIVSLDFLGQPMDCISDFLFTEENLKMRQGELLYLHIFAQIAQLRSHYSIFDALFHLAALFQTWRTDL